MDEKSTENKKKMHKCTHCQKAFGTTSGLINHEKSHFTRKFQLCEDCGKEFRDSFNFKRHVMKIHSSGKFNSEENNIFQKAFESKTEFQEWKDKVQKETSSKYVQHRAPRVNRDGSVVTVLYCHRSGFYHPSGLGIRQPKLVGSNKISSFCPSKITVKEANGSFYVKFQTVHKGHTLDVVKCDTTDDKPFETKYTGHTLDVKDEKTGDNQSEIVFKSEATHKGIPKDVKFGTTGENQSVDVKSVATHEEKKNAETQKEKELDNPTADLSQFIVPDEIKTEEPVNEKLQARLKGKIKRKKCNRTDHGSLPEQLTGETLYFNSKTEFELWKENMERETLTRYVRKRSPRMNKDGCMTSILYCHGMYKSQSKDICNVKLVGSSKTSLCPSRLKIKEGNGKLTVVFVKKHSGHDTGPFQMQIFANFCEVLQKQKQAKKKEELTINAVGEEAAALLPDETGTDADVQIPSVNRSLTTELSPFVILPHSNGISEQEEMEQESLEKRKEDFLGKIKTVLERVDSEEKLKAISELLNSVETDVTHTETENQVPTLLDMSQNNVEAESLGKRLQTTIDEMNRRKVLKKD